MEIRMVQCGECFFATGQFDKWQDGVHIFNLTDKLIGAQMWTGGEPISPEDIAEYVGGRVVKYKEVPNVK